MIKAENKKRFGKGISIMLYVFSGLMLVSSVVILMILWSTARSVKGYEAYFWMVGIGEMAQIVLRPLQAGITNLGVLIFVFLLVLSILLASAGWLIARQTSLLERVVDLELRLEDLDQQV